MTTRVGSMGVCYHTFIIFELFSINFDASSQKNVSDGTFHTFLLYFARKHGKLQFEKFKQFSFRLLEVGKMGRIYYLTFGRHILVLPVRVFLSFFGRRLKIFQIFRPPTYVTCTSQKQKLKHQHACVGKIPEHSRDYKLQAYNKKLFRTT